jgi:hypothetical protein
MPSRKTHAKKSKKSKTNKITQTGCASRKKVQKGGAVGTMFSESPIIFSRTVYPLETSGGLEKQIDARQTGGKSRRHKRKYSRRYYKQSGGSGVASYSPSAFEVYNQPINKLYTDSNRFLV